MAYPHPTNTDAAEEISVYSNCPINWNESIFETIRPAKIQLGTLTHKVFVETRTESSQTLDIARLTEYRAKLKEAIKADLLMRSWETMDMITGSVKSPFSEPKSEIVAGREYSENWTRDLSWLRLNTQTLPQFAFSLSHDVASHFNSYINFQKDSIRKFKLDSSLDDSDFWINEMLEPRKMAMKFQHYTTFLNIMFTQCFVAAETLCKILSKAQVDFARLLEMMIDS